MTIATNEAKQRLRRFSIDCANTSPLYSWLSARAADDDRVARLLTAGNPESSVAPLLFAATQYLLSKHSDHPLAAYYPNLGGNAATTEQTWQAFRSFALGNSADIREVIGNRSIQTNELGRAALLYPALARASAASGDPIALIELGCSAGLLLAFDKHPIKYNLPDGTTRAVGPDTGGIQLHCRVHKHPLPPVDAPVVAERIGIDRDPIDGADPEQRRWLESCVWADQPRRLARLRDALDQISTTPHTILRGDAVDTVGAAVQLIPARRTVVVVTTWSMLYLQLDRRHELLSEFSKISKHRPLLWIDNGPYEDGPALIDPSHVDLVFSRTRQPTLASVTWSGGKARMRILARTDSFGRHLTWLGGHSGPDSPLASQ